MQGIKQENDKDGRIERRLGDKNEVEVKERRERKKERTKERKKKQTTKNNYNRKK